jgi:hypothetical protein
VLPEVTTKTRDEVLLQKMVGFLHSIAVICSVFHFLYFNYSL